MLNIALVAAGGAIGSVLRYLVGLAAARSLGPVFPFGTLTVNLVGGFLIGLVAGVFAIRAEAPQELRVFLITGCLGGFTTFSAFSLDVVTLLERGDSGLAALYLLVSVGFSIAAVFAGLALMRTIL
ncbi:fluoride efflux transporter CrcB [Rhizobium sp. CC-YZS058]|uniref:fluoride efflux transporter CrcB n=1 Tax=Rhizobium sp. CC-YZS058 TaxID=3042153 RepID=UPI002B05DE38|nr:fluoride efflux transporter CrcB [Rhizobium sp. CC-YZS058]MEA3535115.1 fluoride efflux transporter CrcB [Rhizobium sp. CC-YZS058]